MNIPIRIAIALTCLSGAQVIQACGEPLPAPAVSASASQPNGAGVQLALLLDTSSSMAGLINQARAQMWSIVNEFITARRNGVAPTVEVALYEYGNNSLNIEENWIRCVLPLTRDLDEVSRRLFELTTGGGDEYCGAVVAHAVSHLAWNRTPGTYKAIFIAGNEPFTQGPVDAMESCRSAVAGGIVVNTIHCGPADAQTGEDWKAGSVVADGRFLTIDSNQAVADVPAPQDAEIVRLSGELNGTYVGYGRNYRFYSTNQMAQDGNAAQLAPGAAVGRAVTKASALYDNSAWDLVDAFRNGTTDPATIDRELLPESLRSLSGEELKRYVEVQSAKRTSLQAQIQALNAARQEFLASHRSGNDQSLANAVITTVREQAAKHEIRWETK